MGNGPDWGAAASGAGAGAAIGSAVAPGLGTIIGGGIGFLAPIIGDLIGRALAAGDREKAAQYAKMAVDQFGPEVLQTPELKDLIPHIGPSAMQTAAADPVAIEGQRQALAELQRLGRDPNNIEFRGAMNDAEQAANQQAGAQQGAIQQQLAARGMGGSGVDFALRAQAGQNAANRASSAGFDAAKEGRRQALEALRGSGSLAGQMRGQSWDEASGRARAADEVNRFNETGRANAYQQDWQNRRGVAGDRANAYNNFSNVQAGNAAQTQQQFGNYGQAAGKAAGDYAKYDPDGDVLKKLFGG